MDSGVRDVGEEEVMEGAVDVALEGAVAAVEEVEIEGGAEAEEMD